MSENSITAASLQPELWTISSNDALKLFITDSQGAINIPPVFTYPIFGDSETIYGYKDLVIFLCFDHYTFRPFLNIKYSEKLNDPEIEDPKEKIIQFLPESITFKDEIKWADETKEEKIDYKIPGNIIDSFQKDGEEYEIYKIDLQKSAGLELHKRLQILVLLFIEAGSYIDSSDPLWDEYVLYKKGETPSIVGFTSVYNYWKYPGFEKFNQDKNEIRLKVSQFIILPNYQGQGLGQNFYSKLFEMWLKTDEIIEIVIEDPNESFDDMRDRCDLIKLTTSVNLSVLNTKADKQWLENARTSLKLEKRQFARLIEMVLLYKLKKNISSSDSKRDVRLYIKKRLFEKNKEGLIALDPSTKKDKLQGAYEALEEDYYRILSSVTIPIKRLHNDQKNHDVKRPKHG